ncbi:aminoglycoside phosphotransferase/kinase family protein [Pseudonocardia phyllosphaerae]|uniref:hypothetical protein n=1 Tax=Pseudonocardia phyllosphaerae TaxID=3390502 RepID=UPI00397D66A4
MPAVWVREWCRDHLGAEPVDELFRLDQMSTVLGLRLADGSEVVLKSRYDDDRADACITAQARLADAGLPCARPLTPAIRVGSSVVHAEEYRPGGEILAGDCPEVAARYAEVFADLAAVLENVVVPPPLPNPRWIAWDHTGPGLWPEIGELDSRDQSAVPGHVVTTAERAHARLSATALRCVLGHADYEAQNLRWRDGEIRAVHDWDSLAWQPEAALVGAASGTFPSARPPTLAPVASSKAFLETYQHRRGRLFTAEETEIAWAASLWPAAHNARWEALHGTAPIAERALRDQAAERLRRAGC